MNRRILIQVTAPAVLIGLLLLAACLVSAWHVNRLQTDMTGILASNVASMHAAQEMEISVRRLRFHCFAYLVDPDASVLHEMQEDHQRFEHWLERAGELGFTPEERSLVQQIRQGYDLYRQEFERLKEQAERDGPRRDFSALMSAHPLRYVVEPTREYLVVNERQMQQISQESAGLSERLRLTLLLLGLGAPLGGLLSGYGIARGLSRSLHRLSVHVQGMAQRLDREVADVRLSGDGDIHQLDEQLRHVVGRVTEVTERLQRQQRDMLRAQQLAAVGQLAASVAHEVRNPLTSIKMLVQAGLRKQKPKPITQEHLEIIHGEVLRLEETVQGFLDFARPPALQRADCDLREVVTQAVELVRARARQQRVVIDVRCPDQPAPACVDRGQLCTVLVNLFVNALDAMPTGGRLGVVLESAVSGIRLEVADTGSGISAEAAEQLFTPFVSSKPTGSGLGLSISKRIIEEHGGRLAGGNRAEGGACFAVTLPATAGEEQHACPAGH